MGNGKKTQPAGHAGGTAKEKHRRAIRPDLAMQPMPLPVLDARKAPPRTKIPSYFEFVENKDKKKKLEVSVTRSTTPPPGYEFVPIGNPELSTLCKEISREDGAMIMIVTTKGVGGDDSLVSQVNRYGLHIRQSIVERARAQLGQAASASLAHLGVPERIPRTQAEINAQADAAIRDLFPRIPNTDRQQIIEHAFNKHAAIEGRVGLVPDLSLSRRVQLAVLAHIRHNHTRYDEILRHTDWMHARKLVEPLCLDMIVKWRGDEETGRDQLDEILREVVVISDSDSDGDESDDSADDSDESGEQTDVAAAPEQAAVAASEAAAPIAQPMITGDGINLSADSALPRMTRRQLRKKGKLALRQKHNGSGKAKGAARKHGNGENRAQTTRMLRRRAAVWDAAVQRNRAGGPVAGGHAPVMDRSVSHGSRQRGPMNTAMPQHGYNLRSLHGTDPAMTPGSRPDFTPDEYYDPRQPLIGARPPAVDGMINQQPQLDMRYPPHSPPRHLAHRRLEPNDQAMSLDYGSSATSPTQHTPRPPPTYRYQDLLVRSIEASSPEALHHPHFQRAPSQAPPPFLDLSRHRVSQDQGLMSPLWGPPLQEAAAGHRRMFSDQVGHIRTPLGDNYMGREMSNRTSFAYDPAAQRQRPRDDISIRSYLEPRDAPAYQSVSDGVLRGGEHLYREDAPLRSRARPIVVDDPGMHPGQNVVRTHQDIRERLGLGDDCEILEVRRPAAPSRAPAQHREVILLDDSPVRLRDRVGDMAMDRIPMQKPFQHVPEPKMESPRTELRYAPAVPEPAIFVRRVEHGPVPPYLYAQPTKLEHHRRGEVGSEGTQHGYMDREPRHSVYASGYEEAGHRDDGRQPDGHHRQLPGYELREPAVIEAAFPVPRDYRPTQQQPQPPPPRRYPSGTVVILQ